MTKIWTIIRHNQGLVISCCIVIGVLIWAYGCQSQTKSVTNPHTLVTRAELDIEIETFLATAKIRYIELDQQDEFKRVFFNTAINFMEGGTINPVAIAIVLGNILGLGAVIDNRRKDVVIKTLKGTNGKNKETT